MISRRAFLGGLAAGILAAPLAAEAQQTRKVPRIGLLALNPAASPHLPEAFLQGLRDLGYVEGRNVVIEHRSAEGKLVERLPALAAELVALKVDVILAGATPAALAAKQATRTLPIVFAGVGDAVTDGLVTSLARPGGNVTGASIFAPKLVGKCLEQLKQAVPGVSRVASADSVRSDGSKVEVFGPNPKGTLIFTSDGHFALVQMRSDLPKLESNSRDRGTPEEYKAVVQGSIAYFGTYAVNEAEQIITLQIEGSTFANLLGGGEQKRIVTSLTADELKFVNPRTPSGATLEVGWKRAR